MKLVPLKSPALATGHSPLPEPRGLQNNNKNMKQYIKIYIFKVFQGIGGEIVGGWLGGGWGVMGERLGRPGASIFKCF